MGKDSKAREERNLGVFKIRHKERKRRGKHTFLGFDLRGVGKLVASVGIEPT